MTTAVNNQTHTRTHTAYNDRNLEEIVVSWRKIIYWIFVMLVCFIIES